MLIFTRVLTLIFFLHSYVWAVPKDIQLLKAYQAVVSSYNNDPIKFIKNHKSKVLQIFHRDEDHKFLKQQLNLIDKNKLELRLKLENNQFTFTGKKHQLVFGVENMEESKFLVNGKQWQLMNQLSLKDNFNILADILDTTQKTSWIPNIISEAYALGLLAKIILVILALLVAAFFVNEYLMAKFLEKLKELERLCEETEEQGKEQANKFFKLHDYFKDKVSEKLIEKANITNCSDFVEELSKDDDYSYNREESNQICKVSQNIEHCYDTFKIQRAQNNSDRGLGNKESSFKGNVEKEGPKQEALPNQ